VSGAWQEFEQRRRDRTAGFRRSQASLCAAAGVADGTSAMPSLNFRDWTWWREEHGHVVDPHTMLGQLLSDPEVDAAARAEEEEEASAFVANGAAAMVAYGDLQRRDRPDVERRRLEAQLLRYCELDTPAMVMVYQALREWVR